MWKLEGYDAFDEEYYPIEGKWPTEAEAQEAARTKLREIEALQPTENSGGQTDWGLQDRIFIVRPDGTMYRFFPVNR